MTESNRIEYKRELSDGLEREVVAFLNYHDGGIIYIGIDKHGQTVGMRDADALQLAIKDWIKHNIQPSALGLFDLIDSKEYGYCCLVKTCKRVLERLEDVENRVRTQITPRERIETPLWNPVALREAVINAIIHNNYSTELVPKFEIFNDRLEITSAGAIHPGKEQEDFFSGYSMPRNKTLMRVIKDLGMVEYLGSGMPRLLKAYPREAFTFASQFIRLSMPMSEAAHMTGQVTGQVQKLLQVAKGEQSRSALMQSLGLASRENFEKLYLRPAVDAGLLEMTIPDKPQSRLQKYRLTERGSEQIRTQSMAGEKNKPEQGNVHH